jgi:hypothetical protein
MRGRARNRMGVFGLAAVLTGATAVGLMPSYTFSRATAHGTLGIQKDAAMKHATGPFEVKITPLEPANKTEDNSLGRMLLEKQFHGDLEASSRGEMLTAGSVAKGSGGYVAIEKVSGTLNGRTGTFILQHNATMDHGTPHLNIVVVPDSGTGQLAGISGTLNIIIESGKHSYDFAYSLPGEK